MTQAIQNNKQEQVEKKEVGEGSEKLFNPRKFVKLPFFSALFNNLGLTKHKKEKVCKVTKWMNKFDNKKCHLGKDCNDKVEKDKSSSDHEEDEQPLDAKEVEIEIDDNKKDEKNEEELPFTIDNLEAERINPQLLFFIGNPAGKNYFRKFLDRQHASENLLFYETASQYRQRWEDYTIQIQEAIGAGLSVKNVERRHRFSLSKNGNYINQRMQAEAKVIYEKYISPEADLQVSFDSGTFKDITTNLNGEIDFRIFDKCIISACSDISTDSFMRFMGSNEFRGSVGQLVKDMDQTLSVVKITKDNVNDQIKKHLNATDFTDSSSPFHELLRNPVFITILKKQLADSKSSDDLALVNFIIDSYQIENSNCPKLASMVHTIYERHFVPKEDDDSESLLVYKVLEEYSNENLYDDVVELYKGKRILKNIFAHVREVVTHWIISQTIPKFVTTRYFRALEKAMSDFNSRKVSFSEILDSNTYNKYFARFLKEKKNDVGARLLEYYNQSVAFEKSYQKATNSSFAFLKQKKILLEIYTTIYRPYYASVPVKVQGYVDFKNLLKRVINQNNYKFKIKRNSTFKNKAAVAKTIYKVKSKVKRKVMREHVKQLRLIIDSSRQSSVLSLQKNFEQFKESKYFSAISLVKKQKMQKIAA